MNHNFNDADIALIAEINEFNKINKIKGNKSKHKFEALFVARFSDGTPAKEYIGKDVSSMVENIELDSKPSE